MLDSGDPIHDAPSNAFAAPSATAGSSLHRSTRDQLQERLGRELSVELTDEERAWLDGAAGDGNAVGPPIRPRGTQASAISGARLVLTCGLPGSGKTTLAEQLTAERRALRLSKDEWLWAIGSDPWDTTTGRLLERRLIDLAIEATGLGTTVVLDFGLWHRFERDRLRMLARRRGVGVELHYLSGSLDELWARIELRNQQPPWDAAPIERSHLDSWSATFEPPDPTELMLFDPPPADPT